MLDWEYRGIVTFVSDEWGTEYMHLFWSDRFEGTLKECDEGVLEWIDKDELLTKNIWQGDKIFLRLLDERVPFFSSSWSTTATHSRARCWMEKSSILKFSPCAAFFFVAQGLLLKEVSLHMDHLLHGNNCPVGEGEGFGKAVQFSDSAGDGAVSTAAFLSSCTK